MLSVRAEKGNKRHHMCGQSSRGPRAAFETVREENSIRPEQYEENMQSVI